MTNPPPYRFDINNAQEPRECDVPGLAKIICFFGKTEINPRLRRDDRLSLSSTDSGLEAFSHYLTDCSFATLAFQPTANAIDLNQRFLSY